MFTHCSSKRVSHSYWKPFSVFIVAQNRHFLSALSGRHLAALLLSPPGFQAIGGRPDTMPTAARSSRCFCSERGSFTAASHLQWGKCGLKTRSEPRRRQLLWVCGRGGRGASVSGPLCPSGLSGPDRGVCTLPQRAHRFRRAPSDGCSACV